MLNHFSDHPVRPKTRTAEKSREVKGQEARVQILFLTPKQVSNPLCLPYPSHLQAAFTVL